MEIKSLTMKSSALFVGVLSLVTAASAISYCYKYSPMGGYVVDLEAGPPAVDKSCTEVKADLVAAGEGETPRCLENGHYDLFQCEGNECFCTDCAGLKIENYQIFLKGEDGESQCVCAREAHEFQRSGMVGISHRCDPNGGHYKPYQCQGTGCHCTEKDGKYIETEDTEAQFHPWTAEGKDEYCAGLQAN